MAARRVRRLHPPGWFWHEKENEKVKTPAQLLDLYYKSVGRGASFLLNIPPDRRGLLHENDVASLAGFGKILRDTFATNLAEKAKWKRSRNEIELELGHHVTFNVIRLRENIAQGQRIDLRGYRRNKGRWLVEIAQATSIGNCRLIRTPRNITTSRLRVRISSPVDPLPSDIGLFKESVTM